MSKRKRAKQRAEVSVGKLPKWRPTTSEAHIRFSFAIFDNTDWCSRELSDNARFRVIAAKLRNYESMTWNEIISRDHTVALKKLIKQARQRIVELELDDAEGSLWRFELQGLERLWGIRVRSVLYVLWWDPKHQICPVTK